MKIQKLELKSKLLDTKIGFALAPTNQVNMNSPLLEAILGYWIEETDIGVKIGSNETTKICVVMYVYEVCDMRVRAQVYESTTKNQN